MTLSKSQYIRGLQCHKSLWLYKHRSELRDKSDKNEAFLFSTGNQVGNSAKRLFPNDDELNYKKLGSIQNGRDAMDTFANLYLLKAISKRDEIRKDLLAYCRLDTLAMVRIWKKLHKIVRSFPVKGEVLSI